MNLRLSPWASLRATTTPVEGRKVDVRYRINTGNTAPSPLAIIRNHQQAIAAIGGTVRDEDPRYTILCVTKDDKEVWAQVDTAWSGGYGPLAPVASNDSEDGRARNRRVELVKQ